MSATNNGFFFLQFLRKGNVIKPGIKSNIAEQSSYGKSINSSCAVGEFHVCYGN